MTFQFKKATRTQAKLRLALIGPSGSGKTWTALTFAKTLGKRVAVIDSEHESASLYAGDVADFDALGLTTFAPRTYVEAIKAAEQQGYDVIVVDSLSHAWAGKDGALEMVDKAAKRSQAGNSYTAWRDVTPEHNALVDAMVQCKAHLIVTMRSKTEYVLQEDSRGKKVPKKIGMAPIQRDGLEYEFTVVAEMDLDHNFMVSKTRCNALDGAVISKPGPEVANTLLAWLNSGAPMQERAARPQEAPPTASGASTSRTTTAHGGNTPEPKRDEFGIAMPVIGPCPRFRSGDDQGKLWSDVSGAKIEAIAKEHGSKFNELQTEWAQYLIARRAARKAKEAREATSDPEPPADVKLPGDEAAQ